MLYLRAFLPFFPPAAGAAPPADDAPPTVSVLAEERAFDAAGEEEGAAGLSMSLASWRVSGSMRDCGSRSRGVGSSVEDGQARDRQG